MSTSKSPIWERQGRPKPPEIGTAPVGDDYARIYRRWSICRESLGDWVTFPPDDGEPLIFTTFAKAIAYADKESRSHVCN